MLKKILLAASGACVLLTANVAIAAMSDAPKTLKVALC
ncbi:hypothetical protein SAMN05421760_101401 [Neptunomonas antarctica]|uniref:Uncharacterized protein n=1 Tax=Neptunomonas antarctica TaxID=619304 RepID=A0A1N7IZW3_9GAMM|nr:hypothetical protein SAMN05421760_101401 [Neptunomonas antarctica]